MENITPHELASATEKGLNSSKNKKTTICHYIDHQVVNLPSRTAIIDGTIRIDYQTLQQKPMHLREIWPIETYLLDRL